MIPLVEVTLASTSLGLPGPFAPVELAPGVLFSAA